MGQPLEAKGYGGSVTFDGQFVEIKRSGLGRLVVGKGTKRIHVRHISSIQVKPAGPMTNGFIQFSMSGGDERRSQFGRQTFDAAGDENSMIFTRKQQPAFEQLRRAIEDAMSVPPPIQQVAPPSGLADQLAKLSQLRSTGALSDAEFEAAKAQLLR